MMMSLETDPSRTKKYSPVWSGELLLCACVSPLSHFITVCNYSLLALSTCRLHFDLIAICTHFGSFTLSASLWVFWPTNLSIVAWPLCVWHCQHHRNDRHFLSESNGRARTKTTESSLNDKQTWQLGMLPAPRSYQPVVSSLVMG